MVGICRLCASVRKRETLTAMSNEVCQQLRRCFALELHPEGDSLPKCVCVACTNSLQLAFAFYKQIKESQESLAVLFGEHQPSPALHEDLVATRERLSLRAESVGSNNQSLENVEVDPNATKPKSSSVCEVMQSENIEPEEDYLLEVYKIVATEDFSTEPPFEEQIPGDASQESAIEKKEAVKSEAGDSSTEDEHETEELSCSGREAGQSEVAVLPVTAWREYAWRCYVCSHSASSCQSLHTHAQQSHGVAVADMQYMCADCQKVCVRYNSFINHVRQRHHAELALRCDACDECFSDHAKLASHRQQAAQCNAAADYPPVALCSVCGKCFPNSNAARVHARAQHAATARRYQCTHCDKSVKRIGALRAHQRIHSDVKEFSCELCGREFRQKANLDVHLYAHISEKNYECSICKKSLKTAINLEKHKLVHRNIKKYKCDHCEKSFRTRDAKRSHERTHTGEKPYLCVYCERRFRFRSTFISHIYTHTGERPYSCLECNHHFTNWPNFNKHMKRRHGSSGVVKGGNKNGERIKTTKMQEQLIEITVVQSSDLQEDEEESTLDECASAATF